MFFFRKFYRWRYFRRQRAQSYRPFIGAGKGFGISFGRHLARSTREGKEFSGFRDRLSRRKRRFFKIGVALIFLVFLGWVVYESAFGLSLF
ncbi:hypothetical protein [Puniceicoccus vermicola]|uniref:Uncharacterized protein n=1 Tax=Puniceicoccus vermicola TaxID=388746 RepID=A0A7X1AXI2_9BACT|nr:hypothetical protein [Puniceicoccus vermicola]MBC2601682.1 hypothetical protein [Puniceicoccus vermicola]